MNLEGTHIKLRALEPEDLEYVHQLENDDDLWHLSTTVTPYSKFVIKKYLENANADIFETKQLRLVICLQKENISIGLIDLFDFDPIHQRAGLGIVIYPKKYRSQGYGREVLEVMLKYVFAYLPLQQLFASVEISNESSLKLFQSLGFEKSGIRKKWNFHDGAWHDEVFLQIFKDSIA